MSFREAEFVVCSYNEWAWRWNKQELSRDLPLSPHWDDAIYLAIRRPKALFAFRLRGSNRAGVLRVEGWEAMPSSLHSRYSFCRKPIDLENVQWGGWKVEPIMGLRQARLWYANDPEELKRYMAERAARGVRR
jgi:hypothetical protein